MEKEQSFNDAATTGHPHAKKINIDTDPVGLL